MNPWAPVGSSIYSFWWPGGRALRNVGTCVSHKLLKHVDQHSQGSEYCSLYRMGHSTRPAGGVTGRGSLADDLSSFHRDIYINRANQDERGTLWLGFKMVSHRIVSKSNVLYQMFQFSGEVSLELWNPKWKLFHGRWHSVGFRKFPKSQKVYKFCHLNIDDSELLQLLHCCGSHLISLGLGINPE